MCIVFSIIGRVCWCSRVTISSMFIDGSSYVSFPRPFILCIHFVVCFESEMSSLLLGTPGHCPIHHCVHCWCDFTPCLIWVYHYSPLYYSFHHHSPLRFWFIILISPLAIFSYHPLLFLVWHFTCIVLTPSAIRSFSSSPRYWYHVHVGRI